MAYDPIQEASDPATEPERLRELIWHDNRDVRRAVFRNPAVPEDVWRKFLLRGDPEPWDNPMAPFYLLTWTPHEGDLNILEFAARRAMSDLWGDPERCSPEGKALLNAKVDEGWATSTSARDMISFLERWERWFPDDHLEVVRILVLCVRTAPRLTDGDRQALDLLEVWTMGGENRNNKAKGLAASQAVKDTVLFARNSRNNPWYTIDKVLEAVASDKQGAERQEAIAEHERHLADVIRRERPLPPMVK
jgi:hypothetical protein